MRLTAICLLTLALTLPACERGARTSAAPERADAAERDRYQNLVSARLADFDHRFDGLDARLKGLSKADQERLKVDIAELRDRKDALQRKYKDLKGVSEESWRDLKQSVDRDMDQLEMAYNVVAANNQGQSHEQRAAPTH